MAYVTVEKYPPGVEFSKNPVVFKLKTTNMFSAAGSKASLKLLVNGIDTVAGHSFRLQWGANNILFTLASAPDESGTEIQAATAGEVACDFGTYIRDGLKSNYLLSKDFVITGACSGNYTITITAKEKGSEFSLTFSNNTVTNLSVDTNTAGTDPVMRDNYKLVTRAFLKDGASEIFLGEDRISPDNDGYAHFNVAGLLHPEVINAPEFSFPESVSNFLIDRSAQCRQFFIRYAEVYDNVVKKLRSTESNDNMIIPGGIDHIKLAKYHEDDSSFWDMMQYNKDFLTWQPVTKNIWIRQPEKLYYLVWDASTTTIKLKIKIYYTDGTDHTLTKDSETASQYEVWECILSYNKLDLISLPESQNKEIEKYEVWIDDQGDNKISISRFFVLDRKIHTNKRIFIFGNSLSGYDTLRCTGQTVKTTDLARSTIEVLNDFDFTSLDHQMKDNVVFETQKYKTNTGWVSKEYVEYLREFELSTQVYEFILNRLYPVIITTKKATIHKDFENLHQLEFEYARAYKDSHYSADENILGSKNFNKSFNTSYLTGEWHG